MQTSKVGSGSRVSDVQTSRVASLRPKSWLLKSATCVALFWGCGNSTPGDQQPEQVGSAQQALTLGVPLRIKALDYNTFQDSDTTHEGNCGSGPVDAETTSDPNGGTCDVGWTHPGEWLEYSLQVATAGKFHLVPRVASALSGKTFRVSLDGVDLSGSLGVPNSGWQAFADRPIKDVSIAAGTHALRVSFETGDTNLNYIDVTPGTTTLPARIEAENYQRAFDSTPAGNTGNACDRRDGVDKENTGDTAGGGCNIGWTTPGEWLEYDVNVVQAGSYNILARVGTGANGHTVRLSIDGTDIGTLSVPNVGWSTFQDRTLTTSMSAGTHVLRVTFPDGDTNLNYLNVTSNMPPPVVVPHRIKALAYSAFQDSDTTHEGNCGSGPVDAEVTSDPTGGDCDVGWTHPGEWLEYPIQVPSAGKYDLTARLASAQAGKTVRLLTDGQDVSGALSVPSGGWQAFSDRGVKDVSLSAGVHTLRVSFETGDTNFNYVDIAPGTVDLPARIEAENYQRAFDSTPATNSGNACDRGDGVDKENTADMAGGGCNIGWTTPTDWVEYDIKVAQAGTFDITARVGSGVDGRTLQLALDGTNIGTLAVPNIGWTSFQDRTLANVSVAAGAHTLRVSFPQGETNLNYLNFSAVTSSNVPPSTAQSFGVAADYNVFVFQDVQNTPTIGGPVAAGRDVLAQGFGYNTSSSGSVGVVAGRSISAGNGSIHRDLIYGTSQSLSDVGVLDGVARQGAPVDFAAEKTALQGLASAFANLPVNGTATVSQGGTTIDFAASDTSRNVFTLAGSALAPTDVLRFAVPSASTVVVNVTGTNAVFETTGMQLNGLAPGHLIWNFRDATSVRLSLMGFSGTLLAPNAAVSQNGSTIDGVLIAQSLYGGDNGLTWSPFNGSWPLPGATGQPCTASTQCQQGLTCQSGYCGCAPGNGNCSTGSPCTRPSDCQAGLTCGLDEGERYDGPWSDVCLPVSCLSHGPDHPDCGTPESACGVCPACAVPGGCGPIRKFSFQPPTHMVAGAVTGAFAVTGAGAASYSVPLALPPGRGDMTPQLGLVYDSANRQELLAEGWQLQGFSYISRCVRPAVPPSAHLEFDATIPRRGVRGDSDDQLCLDGQFLMRAPALDENGGTAEGYVTVNESFQRIRGFNGTGPDAKYFKVWTAEGRILTYGTPSSDAGVVLMNLQDRRRRVWALTKIEDQVGNYIEYTYGTNEGGAVSAGTVHADTVCERSPQLCGTTEIWPEEIRYTGGPGHTPTRSVRFRYETDAIPEPISGYVAGVQTTRTHLLNRIDLNVDDVIVRSYLLENELTDDAKHDLKRLWDCTQELDDPSHPLGTTHQLCKAPTEFGYRTSAGLGPAVDTGVDFKPSSETPPGPGQFIVWDRDGDGQDDLITTQGDSEGGQWVQISPTHGNGSPLTKTAFPYYQFRKAGRNPNPITTYREFTQSGVLDIDGDGLEDLVETTIRGQENLMALKGGFSHTAITQSSSDGSHDSLRLPLRGDLPNLSAMFIDIDGDGFSDLLTTQMDLAEQHWRRNRGDGLFDDEQQLANQDFSELFLTFADADGDGVAEVLGQPQTNAGNTTARVLSWQAWEPEQRVPYPPMVNDDRATEMHQGTLDVDTNGDGLKDLLVRTPPGTFTDSERVPVVLWTNTGHGFVEAGHVADLTHQEFQGLRVVDYNGDGREDVLSWSSTGWKVFLGRESALDAEDLPAGALSSPGLFAYADSDREQFVTLHPWTAVADLDGDGSNDLLVVKCTGQANGACQGGHIWAHFGRAATAHMLETVTDGLGERTEVEYDENKPGPRVGVEIDGVGRYDEPGYSRGPTEDESDNSKVLTRVGRPLVVKTRISKRVGDDDYEFSHGTQHYYVGGRIDAGGRGWLGFDGTLVRNFDGNGDGAIVSTSYDDNHFLQNPDSVAPPGHICPPGIPEEACAPPPSVEETWHYPFAGFPTRIETIFPAVTAQHSADGKRHLKEVVENDWSYAPDLVSDGAGDLSGITVTGRVTFPFLSSRRTAHIELGSTGTGTRELFAVEESFNTDHEGNVVKHDLWTVNQDGVKVDHTLIQQVYEFPKLDRWLLRVLSDSILTRGRGTFSPSGDLLTGDQSTRKVRYGHDQFGLLTSKTRLGKKLITTYHRNAVGNVDRIETKGDTGPTRVTVVDAFDDDEIFPKHLTVQPGAANEGEAGDVPLAPHTTAVIYDERFGKVVQSTDSNDFEETWKYDGFGRLIRHDAPDGSGETTTYGEASFDNSGAVPVAAVFRTSTTADGGGIQHVDIDSFGRQVRSVSRSVASVSAAGTATHVNVVQETTYDESGRVHQVSRPHLEGDSSQGVTTYTYNALDELTAVETADNKTTRLDRVDFSSLTAAEAGALVTSAGEAAVVSYVQDARGAVETRVFDVEGDLILSLDADGGEVDYHHDGFGAVTLIDAPHGMVQSHYDEVGRLENVDDPDRGLHEYTYTDLDELLTHTRPGVNGSSTRVTETFHYDAFGRLKKLEGPDGLRRWQYDQAPHGIGRISGAFADAGGTNQHASSTSYEYDGRGRLSALHKTIAGESFTTSPEYTPEGRPRVINYPAIGNTPFRVELVTDPETGMLIQTRDADAPATSYWRLTQTFQGYLPKSEQVGPAVTTTRSYFDDSGLPSRILTEALGNAIQDESYTFDDNHNLLTRVGRQASSKQTFEHDSLNRLHRVRDWHGDELERIDYEPQSAGNITYKTGVGDYAYDGPYGPNAVNTAGDLSFEYDDSGNQTARFGGAFDEQRLSYTGFGLPYEITSMTAAATKVAAFDYDAGGSRVLKRDLHLADPNDPDSLHIQEAFHKYVGSLYELRGSCAASGDPGCLSPTRTHVYRVYGGSGEVAQVQREEGANQTVASQRTYYLHGDRLGSASLITAGGDGAGAAGTVLREQRYSPFGTAETTVAGAAAVTSGFTGQEQDDDTGLTNMGGRLYDSLTGRFLTPDPINPAAGWSQGFDAYSYVLNSPLNFVDPSGFAPSDVSDPFHSSPEGAQSHPAEAKAGADQNPNYFSNEWRSGSGKKPAKAAASKERENPGSGTKTAGGDAPKPHPDAGQPGSAGGTKGTAQPGQTTSDTGSGDPGASVQQALNKGRGEHPSGTGPTLMDDVTFVVGMANMMTPDDNGVSGGIPGGHCQGSDCYSGPGVQAVWGGLMLAGPKLISKGAELIAVARAAIGKAASAAASLFDSALNRVTEAFAGKAAEGTSQIANLERVKSGLKVDFVKPIRDGAGKIVKEFPATPIAHGFPNVVDNFAGAATQFELRNGAALFQVEGSLNGVAGRFEWIVDQGSVTHRMFVGGGTVNGVPIIP